MSSPRASLVIRCYNEREYIGKLLHGVFEQTVDDIEVLLVDSGSTDGTLEVARQYPIDDVVFIAPEEFSFGRALNYGCEAASGEFCVFASAHVYPWRRDWLERLLTKFDDPDVALSYGKQRGNDQTRFSERQVFKRWFPDHDIDRQDTPFCNNANAAIRREVWEDHPYDEELTGLEDLDWTKRVRAGGWEVSYAADAAVVHVHDETPREVYNRYRREAIALDTIMDYQTFTVGDFLRTVVTNTLADWRAALAAGEFREWALDIPLFRVLQFLGTYRGFAYDDSVTESLRRRFYYPNRESYPSGDVETADESDLQIDYSEATRGSG